MAYYKLYFLRGDYIYRSEDFFALDDEAALARAAAAAGSAPTELWCRDRKLMAFGAAIAR